MKYILPLLVITTLFIISCNTGNKKSGLFKAPDELKADEYVINIDRDTTIETKNGALLKIQKGSLTTGKGNMVTLEIKEAYSIQQMIQAELVTQTNGDPLSSGGMIYINAKAGQDVKITQAIKVAIPADYLDNTMQLFKGKKDTDGNINWEEPGPLAENKQLSSADQGKLLFQSRCASCHALGKDMTGPNLAHILDRFPINGEGESEAYTDWRYYEHGMHYGEAERAAQNAGRDISMDDRYYHPNPYFVYKCNLLKIFGWTGPVMYTDTTGLDLLNIYRYIQNESGRRNLPLPAHHYLKDCADSCVDYQRTVTDLKAKKETAKSKRKSLVEDNGPLVDKKPDSTWGVTNTPPPDYNERVSPKYYQSEYYQFTIESFGWYNIDALLKGVDGVQESELFVRVVGQYKEKIKIFLIIPSVKTYGEGGPADRNPEEFAFFYKDGKLPLPQNTEAYILAVTETAESIAFGLKKFTTTTKQELEVSLNISTKEEFSAAINGLNAGRLHITVKDSKHAGEIRKTNKEIKNIEQRLKEAENLKPKGCDCNCGTTGATDSVKEYFNK